MFIWFLSIIIFVSVIFLISLYLYDGSPFKKATNYSFFQVMFNRNIRATYKLYRILKTIHKNGKVLLNVKLPNSNDVIDAVYIKPSGVYVIDFNNMNGWLYGHEKAQEWALATYNEQVQKFANPIVYSNVLVKEVQKALSINKSDIFHGLVVFSDNTVFKNLNLQTSKKNVINLRELKPVLKNENKEQLSETEIEEIYKSFASYVL